MADVGDRFDVYAAHLARKSDDPKVAAAGRAWFDVVVRTDMSRRDRSRLLARYEAVICPTAPPNAALPD